MSVLLVLKWARDHPVRLEIPPKARWNQVLEAANSSPIEALEDAASALVFNNRDVFDDSFERMELGKRLSDGDAWQLVALFDKIPLDDEIPGFNHLVGRIYDQVLATFLDDGKRGGQFGTPPSVRQLMVQLANPQPGQSVYDPCVGTGGLLIAADEYVAERTDRHDALALFGQDVNMQQHTLAWLNLNLHGIADASIRIGDALLDPCFQNTTGALRRFDRVLTNPPSGLKYRREMAGSHAHVWYGQMRTADLLFVQHVLASLTSGGVGVMVVANGVLFRGGLEGNIRRSMIQDGRISAVIALGRNIFPNTSVPFSLLVLRGEDTNPDTERDILFINAEHEVDTVRSRTYLAPRHVQKIANAFHRRNDIDHFSRIVSIVEIAKNDFNLNVGNYLFPVPKTPAAPSIESLLFGGVPVNEVEVQRERFDALGIDLNELFVRNQLGHLEFPPSGYETIASTIPSLTAPIETAIVGAVEEWFAEFPLPRNVFTKLPLDAARMYFAETFQAALTERMVLSDEQIAGLFTDWWVANRENITRLRYHNRQPGASTVDVSANILEIVGTDLVARARKLLAQERNQLIDCYLTWGSRYSPSLMELERRRADASSRLEGRMRTLGYQWPFREIEP
ncbi:type I restriction enzyme M protein [Nocardia tenerifensis]|uniref:site-specific DNA-methyltransferase (adenine-specific) n=2 Tax=Nocardia tenerifensis TaxID=228006 RepID=A0A318JVW0_9NOCA|nr:type I restriction enzyme M protein [Nocardia tenerifensis]